VSAPPFFKARLEVGRYGGFFEAHIEQGPDLEAKKLTIGVVTAIVGIDGCEIYFEGQANHAGTTPMALRKDASMAAVVLMGRINDAFLTGELVGPMGSFSPTRKNA
jgi:N-carbamoyl-L-amino-acid hydrolase